MSEQVTKRGVLRKLDVDTSNFPDMIETLKELGYVIESYYEEDQYIESNEVVFVDSAIYVLEENEDIEESDIFEAHEDIEGGINFVLSYYNGSCSFNEAIEEALKRLS